MTDAGFSLLTATVWLVLFALYGLRVYRFGATRSDRVASVGGGTVVLGQNMMEATYWAIAPIVRGLVALGLTPNAVTTIAFVLGIGAGFAVALGWFGLACLLATASTICDILDGQVARMTGTGSDAGELYDAIVDRYTEFAFIAGFIVYARDSWWQIVIALLALQTSFMISYASAKAEAMRVDVPRGLMRRHERAACLTLASGLVPLVGPVLDVRYGLPPTAIFTFGLAIVATIGTSSTVRRIVRMWQVLVRRDR